MALRGVAEGFLKSWGMILVSEIGDKTFFIAAIMAMKHPQKLVFAGAMAALATMTALSAFLGWAAPALISKKWTHWAAVALFFVFGARSLWEGLAGDGGECEKELEEVERELTERHRGTSPNRAGTTAAAGAAKPSSALAAAKDTLASAAASVVPAVVLEAFTLTFLAEWGDRSQVATIGLATTANVWGVTVGGIVGHAICTGAAVLGGRHAAAHIDERTVHLVGGALFLAFGAHAAWTGVEE